MDEKFEVYVVVVYRKRYTVRAADGDAARRMARRQAQEEYDSADDIVVEESKRAPLTPGERETRDGDDWKTP